jgi:hypothetical protein
MTLIIEKPTGAKLVFAQTNNGITDPEAIIYISNVEQADGQPLEYATAKAMHDFVVGCKADGIWNAIKASCILAGARTLAGALVPLVGPAPTNNGFIGIGTDYERKTGLLGNGTSKYLNSNRAGNADPQNNQHLSLYSSSIGTGAQRVLSNGGADSGTSTLAVIVGSPSVTRSRASASGVHTSDSTVGFFGLSRTSSANYLHRNALVNVTHTVTSQAPRSATIDVFRGLSETGQAPFALFSNARLAFYSIGESLPDGPTKSGLELLDERITKLINVDLAAAIP